MKKIGFMFVCLLFSGISNAAIISVDYEVTNNGGFWGGVHLLVLILIWTAC